MNADGTADLPDLPDEVRAAAPTGEATDSRTGPPTESTDSAGAADGHDEPAKPKFGNVEDWVHAIYLPMFGWRVDGQRWHWCPKWWRHIEAIWRLELLWRSWEVARLNPVGMSSWSIEVDRHNVLLLGPDGPFRQCREADADRPDRHTEPTVATADLAPPGWWPKPDPGRDDASDQ